MQEVSSTVPPPLLETRGLSKHFGSLKANDGVDLTVRAGEILAILGENGAGKSTLMKMLYGYYQPTSGQILVEGVPVKLNTPRQGRAQGIGMVFQNFTLIPAFEVWENIALFLDKKPGREELLKKIETLSASYGLEVDPKALVRDLPMGDRQKVEILKILLAGAKILIFDEPTSVLAPHEAENLFRVFDRLRAEGYAVLFITHKMNEVLRSADRITVLRKGKIVATLPRAGTDKNQLIRLLVGEQNSDAVETGPRRISSSQPGIPVVEFIHVSCKTDDGRHGIEGVSLTVLPGEILGVAAVSGNGQEFLGDLILGLRPASEGSIYIAGHDLETASPREVLKKGVACLPEDPIRMGAVGGMTVRENLILGSQSDYWKAGGWSPDKKKLEEDSKAALMTAFVQSPPSLEAFAGNLSGGNLQRVVIAREIGRNPTLMISYYLTRGLDLSNAKAARDLVLSHADKGMGVLFISEDLDELFALSDRLLVLHAGKEAGVFAPSQTTPQAVGLLMTGASHE